MTPKPLAPARVARLLAACALAAGALLAACGDNQRPPADPPADAGIDAAPAALAPCLDRPTDLARPPSGALPCELLPPGFAPPR